MRITLAVTVLLASVAGTAPAQSAQEIFDRMLAAHDRRAAGINDYTVVQEAMGQTSTTYFEKDASGAHPVYRAKQMTVNGMVMENSSQGEAEAEFWEHLPELAKRASYVGRETVDGASVHVVRVTDLASTSFGRGLAPGNAQFEPRQATFYVDPELWMPRRLVFEGRLTLNAKPADVTMTMAMQDYRTVDGLLHPFRSRIRMDGLGQAVDPAMRAQYEQMKKQLAEMPESQRQMVEKMMKGQLEQMEQMMSGDGAMNFEIVVKEVRVNKGR